LWLVTLGVMHGDQVGLVVPGHLDRTLAPFYEADRAAGTLTQEDALVLIESLYLLVNDYIPDGLAMSVMVGGRDSDGNDVTNELSYLCLEALRRTNLIYPTVGVCWHEGTPSELVELAVELIGHGYPTPALFGDETIQRGLRSLGMPADEACRYINSTCVEITPSCASNVWVASPYFPTCTILLDEIAHQVDTKTTAETFDVFRQRYFDRLADIIGVAVDNENKARRDRQEFGRKPLQSVFTRDCIARGRDIDDGGARYNWVECSFVGLANLADSLHVIQREVYEDGGMSLAELKTVLDADFEGFEPVRRRFLDGHPKYGQDCGDVDGLFGKLIAFVRDECGKHRMEPDGSPFVPGAFCWIMHEVLGRECGATPDGRKAGAAFADGCGPAQGREKLGPTAAILSTTSWDHSPMIGGLAYNMKFNRHLFDGPEGFTRLQDLLQTFLRRGGFETQVNVVDAETLRRAREHPETHRDLIVRIGGYCDYFTRLSPEMQEEIILRTAFDSV
jgi:formate C-acetyltransferase